VLPWAAQIEAISPSRSSIEQRWRGMAGEKMLETLDAPAFVSELPG